MKTEGSIKFGEPADYIISVQGEVPKSIVDSFGEIQISLDNNAYGIVITSITVKVKDQSHLSGIINTLYEWGFPILLIEFKAQTVEHN